LSGAARLSIILAIPHRIAVVSFTREHGATPAREIAGIPASGNKKHDPYFRNSQEH
jgi:hypothetical protein